MPPPRTLVIVNPVAARADRRWPSIRDQLQAAGLEFNVHITTRASEATSVARRGIREGIQVVAVVGGDGTLSETAEGFFEFDPDRGISAINPEASLSILPAGTGDDFARSLAGRRQPASHWADALIGHIFEPGGKQSRLIDVIHGRIGIDRRDVTSINVATIGVGAEIATRVGRHAGLIRRLSGDVRFLFGAVPPLWRWDERRVRIAMDDGGETEYSTNLIALANNRFAGGGMMFSPTASPDDGLIDVLVARDFRRLGILRELARIHKGEHLKNPKIQVTKTQRVRIETITPSDSLQIETDGNARGATPAEFELIPTALRVVVPASESSARARLAIG